MNAEVVDKVTHVEFSSWESIFETTMVAKSPSLGVNFVEASKPFREVLMRRHGKRLELEQRLDSHGIAGVVWDAGVAVARLLDNCPTLVQGRTVLDLGCGGSAVAGLAAVCCGATAVKLSDLPEVGDLVEANVRRNITTVTTAATAPDAAETAETAEAAENAENAETAADESSAGGGVASAVGTTSSFSTPCAFEAYHWPTSDETITVDILANGAGVALESASLLSTDTAALEVETSLAATSGSSSPQSSTDGTAAVLPEGPVLPPPPPLPSAGFETVLCADCLYESASLAPLERALRAHSTPGTTLLVLAYKRRVDAREAPCFARLAKDWRFALVPRHLFDPDSFPPSSSSSSLSSPSSSSSSSTSSGIASACSNKQQQQQQQQQSKGQQQQLLGDLHLLIAVRRGHSRGTGTWEGIDGEEDDPSHGAQSLGGSSRGTATGFTAHESSFIEAAFDSKICLDGSSKEALDKFCFLLCTSVSKPIGVRNT